jgi:hypothetical protein
VLFNFLRFGSCFQNFFFNFSGLLVSTQEIQALFDKDPTALSHVVSWRGQGGGIDGLKQPVVGRGGGSFANHNSKPNSRFFRHELGIFLRAISGIRKGQWITVSYGHSFLESAKGQLSQQGITKLT